MKSDANAKTGTGAGAGGGGTAGGFRASVNHFLHSGDKKHVFGGLAVITIIFGAPWYFMTRGSKQQSHQDYLEKAEKADKARKARLSSTA